MNNNTKPKSYAAPQLSPSETQYVKRQLIRWMDEVPVADYARWRKLDSLYWELCGRPEFHPCGSREL